MPHAPYLLTLQQIEEIKKAPPEISNAELAERYGVTRVAIWYYRKKTAKARQTKRRQERRRLAAEKKARAASVTAVMRSREKYERDTKEYEEKIHEMFVSGKTTLDIEKTVWGHLLTLWKERLALDERIFECYAAQDALARYLNSDLVVASSEIMTKGDKREMRMTSHEMDFIMRELSISAGDLANDFAGAYTREAVLGYRHGREIIPKVISDWLRGKYAEKEHENMQARRRAAAYAASNKHPRR